MPYSSISELPEKVKVLPTAAQKMFLKVFNNALKQYKDETRAFKVAWGAVKNKYKKSAEGKWVAKSFSPRFKVYCDNFEFKSEDENYFVEGYLSVRGLDSVNDYVTDECLKDMHSQIELGSNVKVLTGGLEHEHILDDKRNIPILKIVDKKLEDGKLKIKSKINKHHPNFENVWGSIKDGFLNGFSIEFKPESFVNQPNGIRVLNKVKLGGYALTGRPACAGATMTDFYIKSLAISEIEDEIKIKKLEETEGKTMEEPKETPKVEEVKSEVKAEAPKTETPKVEVKSETEELKTRLAEAEKQLAEYKAKFNDEALVQKIKPMIVEEIKKLQPEQKVLQEKEEKFEKKSVPTNFSFIAEWAEGRK